MENEKIKVKVLHYGIKEWPYDSGIKEGKNRGGGTGKYCEMLLHAMDDDVESFIITRKLKGQLKYEKENNIHIYRVNSLPGRKLRIISLAIFSFFKALKLIRKHKIDILQTHIFFNNMVGVILKKLTGIATISVPHSPLYHKYTPQFNNIRRKIERFFDKKFNKYVDKVILFTDEHVKRYKQLSGVRYDNFHVLHTGIKIPDVEMPIFDYDNRKLNFLYVGRLQKIKAFDKVIEALSLMEEPDRNKINFEVVGEGIEKENLEEQVKSFGLENVVKFVGYMQNPSPKYVKADVFIQATNTEGLSMALLESMASWTANVVNNFGVPFSDEAVMVIENNNPETIKNAILKLINNKQLIKNYAIKGGEEVREGYSDIKFAQNYKSLYIELKGNGSNKSEKK